MLDNIFTIKQCATNLQTSQHRLPAIGYWLEMTEFGPLLLVLHHSIALAVFWLYLHLQDGINLKPVQIHIAPLI